MIAVNYDFILLDLAGRLQTCAVFYLGIYDSWGATVFDPETGESIYWIMIEEKKSAQECYEALICWCTSQREYRSCLTGAELDSVAGFWKNLHGAQKINLKKEENDYDEW